MTVCPKGMHVALTAWGQKPGHHVQSCVDSGHFCAQNSTFLQSTQPRALFLYFKGPSARMASQRSCASFLSTSKVLT